MTTMISFRCDHCRKWLRADPAELYSLRPHEGTRRLCRACGDELRRLTGSRRRHNPVGSSGYGI